MQTLDKAAFFSVGSVMLKRGAAHFLFIALLIFGEVGLIQQAIAASLFFYPVKSHFFEQRPYQPFFRYIDKPTSHSGPFLGVSNPTVRAGYYFITALNQPLSQLPEGSVLTLDYMVSTKPNLVSHTFHLPVTNSAKIYLGITGEDWPHADIKPAYWRLTLADAQGIVLAKQQSLRVQSITTERYRNEDAFMHISEYFSGEENNFYRTVLRSDPTSRVGIYFIIKLNQALETFPKGCQFHVNYMTSTLTELQKHVFPLPETGRAEIYLGLTGKDWDPKARIISWEVVLKNKSGQELLKEKSFLFNQEAN